MGFKQADLRQRAKTFVGDLTNTELVEILSRLRDGKLPVDPASTEEVLHYVTSEMVFNEAMYRIHRINAMSPIKESGGGNLSHTALAACQALMIKKSQDYGGGGDPSRKSYHPYGHESYMQMMHTKFTRINAIHQNEKKGVSPNFESRKDSVMDLINYCAFYYAWLEQEEFREKGEL